MLSKTSIKLSKLKFESWMDTNVQYVWECHHPEIPVSSETSKHTFDILGAIEGLQEKIINKEEAASLNKLDSLEQSKSTLNTSDTTVSIEEKIEKEPSEKQKVKSDLPLSLHQQNTNETTGNTFDIIGSMM